MTTPRNPRRPLFQTAASRFPGGLPGRGAPRGYLASRPAPAIDPAIFEATMTMGGWVSWEMVRFISEVASERKKP